MESLNFLTMKCMGKSALVDRLNTGEWICERNLKSHHIRNAVAQAAEHKNTQVIVSYAFITKAECVLLEMAMHDFDGSKWDVRD